MNINECAMGKVFGNKNLLKLIFNRIVDPCCFGSVSRVCKGWNALVKESNLLYRSLQYVKILKGVEGCVITEGSMDKDAIVKGIKLLMRSKISEMDDISKFIQAYLEPLVVDQQCQFVFDVKNDLNIYKLKIDTESLHSLVLMLCFKGEGLYKEGKREELVMRSLFLPLVLFLHMQSCESFKDSSNIIINFEKGWNWLIFKIFNDCYIRQSDFIKEILGKSFSFNIIKEGKRVKRETYEVANLINFVKQVNSLMGEKLRGTEIEEYFK